MKKYIAAAAALTALILILAIAVRYRPDEGELRTGELPAAEAGTDGPDRELREKAADSGIIYAPDTEKNTSEDKKVTLRLLIDGQCTEISLHDYLVGVLAAEMPAAFEPEALRAQAVAARTYTLFRMFEERTVAHPEADVCALPECCEAYLTDGQLAARWGESRDENRALIESAVTDTDGLCLVYGDRAIFAAFHSSSSGYTESGENVFGGNLPYLQSVFSPEDESTVPDYETVRHVTYEEFRAAVCAAFPGAVFPVDPAKWITDVERSFSGRIVSLSIGGQKLSATQLRKLFSLRSACAEISPAPDGFDFLVTGYGHGAGMSQYGANVLAAAGSGFEDILSWYYTSCELRDMAEVYPGLGLNIDVEIRDQL